MDKLNAERLRALDEAATAGPWQGYSEPEVGLPYSLFSGIPMQSGFGPLEPLTGYDIDLVTLLRNSVPAILAMAEELDRKTKALGIANNHYTEMVAENARLREALEDLQGDGTATGTWLESVEPLIARFNVAAQFGADAVHNGTGAKAIADLMQSMADRLDRACIVARRALGKDNANAQG